MEFRMMCHFPKVSQNLKNDCLLIKIFLLLFMCCKPKITLKYKRKTLGLHHTEQVKTSESTNNRSSFFWID